MNITSKFTKSLNEKFAKIENISKNNFDTLMKELTNIRKQLDYSNEHISKLESQNSLLQGVAKTIQQNTIGSTKSLWKLRDSKDYKELYKINKPLVSIRIASYNKTDELINKAIKSCLNQTYKNIEIVIVNDGPNEKTRKAIENIQDSRISYYELPYRGVYPNDDKSRWQVAGSPGMNFGAYMCKGDWIAPLDDDDEFTDDHIEKLLSYALNNKLEVVFGSFEITTIFKNKIIKKEIIKTEIPPEHGSCTMQAAIYLSAIENIFNYNRYSYLYDQPADWEVISRMIDCGVKIGKINDVVVKMVHIGDLSTRA